MVRTLMILLILLAGLALILLVVTDDTPKKRIALHEQYVRYTEP